MISLEPPEVCLAYAARLLNSSCETAHIPHDFHLFLIYLCLLKEDLVPENRVKV